MSTDEKKVFLTGASGLLGRAIYKKFKSGGWDIQGTAFTRVTEDLIKVDITNEKELKDTVAKFQPKFIIHCAAQRFPDKCDKNPKEAELLNVTATEYIAAIAQQRMIPLIFISTDYVFDGKNPPYQPISEPNPVNLYGKTKAEGETITLSKSLKNMILRVPVLYGPVTSLSESAVTSLLQNLLNTEKPITVSNYEKRRPAHVDDIASICFDLLQQKIKDPELKGIFQWSGEEVFTKYQMIQVMSEVFNLKMDHITPDSKEPDPSAAARPFDVTLDSSRLKSLGIHHHTIFKEGIKRDLAKWVQK
nr:PREDICTED: methionine adenosyltransferase 2 subunit beta-like [Bemisia tabaci]